MAITTTKYALQALFELKVFDLSTGEALVILDDLKETTWENNGEEVYSMGGRGNPKLIGFGHSKTSNLNTQNALITDGVLGFQSGTAMSTLTSTTVITYTDILTVGTNAATTTYTATGSVGAEIGFVYKLNSDGSLGTKYTQGATASGTGIFAYTFGTKALAFYSGDLASGDRIVCFYKPTIASAKKFTNATNVFAKNVKVIADGLFRNTCTGVDYAGQLVFYKAKASDGYSFTVTANGEPAVQSINFEALQSCSADTLWDLFVWDTTQVT
jgi:hypothetical protein